MPTYETTSRFTADHQLLTPAERVRFRHAVSAFVDDLRRPGPFRTALRVKGVRRAPGVFELTWSGGGRATWCYGTQLVDGEPHIIWRRIGTHTIFNAP